MNECKKWQSSPEKRPPRQGKNVAREHCAEGEHAKDVEGGTAHDGADAHIVLRDEHPEKSSEEFGCRTAGGHESGACHVVADVQLT